MTSPIEADTGAPRASFACAMPANRWSYPTILDVTDHKRRPRRHRVTSP
jgi:hypothetical protein